MISRRQFIERASLVSLYPLVPTMLSRVASAAGTEADARILVVIQLDGGNDGLNTVVPYGDDAYARHRSALRLDAANLHKLDEHVGLHPQMRAAKELFDDGRLTVVHGVGYPNPDRSHFRSMRIWQTARFDAADHSGYGWLGRALDTHSARPPGQPGAIYAGSEDVPVALWGRRAEAVSITSLDDTKLPPTIQRLVAPANVPNAVPSASENLQQFATRQVLSAYTAAEQFQQQRANETTATYPTTRLAAHLKLIAQLIRSGSRARVFYTSQSGYDTHAAQLYTHARLLSEFSAALKAFLDDMRQAGLDERVAVLTFSEFGRRVEENASQGTDHGAAGPVFLAGGKTIGGQIGPPPNLSNLQDGDLPMQIDFRQIYRAVLEDWLAVDSSAVLGGELPKATVFQA